MRRTGIGNGLAHQLRRITLLGRGHRRDYAEQQQRGHGEQ